MTLHRDYDAWLEAPYMTEDPDPDGEHEAPEDDRSPGERMADEDDYFADLYADGYYEEFPAPTLAQAERDADEFFHNIEGDERLEDEYNNA